MDFEIIIENLPFFMQGLWVTIKYVFISLFIGFFLAIPVALARFSKNMMLNKMAQMYMFVFRGSPLLVQIYIIYYGLAQFEWIRESMFWVLLREAWFCALLTFTLNTAAYTAEILRGAISAVPKGENEAARSLGMSAFIRIRRITLPNAFRRAFPAYTNEVIFMLHGSAIASIISVFDITGVASQVYRQNYSPYEAFLTAALIYLILTNLILFVCRRIEKRLLRHLVH